MGKKKIAKEDTAPVTTTAADTAEDVVRGFNFDRVKFKVLKGSELTDVEHRDVKELVLKNGTIKPDSVDQRIKDAELVILAKEEGKVQGCAAIRKQANSYMQKLIGRSGIVGLGHDSLEFCWVRLRPSRMDKGIEQAMLDAGLAAINSQSEDNAFKDLAGKKVFAVWRTDDENMNKVMVACGFTKHDKDHEALVGEGKRVQLWLYNR
jgi:hypothetical protein